MSAAILMMHLALRIVVFERFIIENDSSSSISLSKRHLFLHHTSIYRSKAFGIFFKFLKVLEAHLGARAQVNLCWRHCSQFLIKQVYHNGKSDCLNIQNLHKSRRKSPRDSFIGLRLSVFRLTNAYNKELYLLLNLYCYILVRFRRRKEDVNVKAQTALENFNN